MHTSSLAASSADWAPHCCVDTRQFGGDQSPLNDSDVDEDRDPEGYLDLEILGLDDFIDADKLDPTLTGDIDSSDLS